MNYRNSSQLLVTFLALVSLGAPLAARTEADYLWQIGKADNNTSEFALGPDGYSKYSDDGMFIVGQSDPKKDWPYAHPAGDDVWAGGAGHTFTILFVLDRVSYYGKCRIHFDLADTHSANPPKLKVKLNDYSLEYQPPKGASDASIMGNPKAGKEHRFTLDFPAKELKKGVNKITITTASGGWILYDWIGFQAPASVRLGEPSGTLIREVRVDPWLTRIKGELSQLVWVDLTQIGDSNGLTLHLGDEKPKELELAPGNRTIELTLPPVKNQTTVEVRIRKGRKTVATTKITRGPATLRRPVDWVDPILGTSQSRWMLYPGPSMPFGMVKLSPDNQRQQWKAGYEYLIGNIAGFSHLHSWTMGGLLTMPTTGPLKTTPGPEGDPDKGYRSRFDHKREYASPGYYAVTLDDYKIRAELTATTRAGFQRYTFPKAAEARILFDLERSAPADTHHGTNSRCTSLSD